MIGLSYGNFQAVTTAPFSFGNALKPDGFDDFILIPDLAIGNNDACFSFWFKSTVFADIIFGRHNGSIGGLNISRTIISINDGLTARNFTVPLMVNDTWYHVFFSFNYANQTGRLWLNGVESSTGEITVRANNMIIKSLVNQNSPVVQRDFAIDELCIWIGVEGTEQNAIDLYNGGNGALASDIISSPTAYWRCNESDGATTLTDETGNYNGTMVNFSTPPAYFIPH